VPNVVGQDKERATILIRNAGLEPQAVAKEDPSCESNRVLRQDPPQGSRVDENSRVTFEWCAGPGEVTIPPVAGLPEARAKSELEDLGLTVTVTPTDSSLPAGTAIETDPVAGEKVAGDSTIVLKVSKGNLKKVPNVVGRTEAEARAVLETTGFLSGNIEVLEATTDDPDRNGRVMFQDPVADSERDPASTTIRITVGVYNDPQPTNTPTPTPTPTP
jgi:serine/threonine-protein kinase